MKLFQKKPLYIVLIVIFTLILIADLVLRFAVGGRSNRPEGFSMPGGWSASEDFDPNNLPEGVDSSNMPEGFQPGSRPEGFDSSNLPEGFDSGNMPGNFDPNNLPEGFDSSNMPEGFQSGSRPEGFDPNNMPEGFDPSQRPGGSSSGSETSDGDTESSQRPQGGPSFGNMPGGGDFRQRRGFLSTVRKLWIPIGIVCLLVDALSVFMLVRIRRKEKRSATAPAGGDAAEDDCGG